ncbi:MAG TPA: P-II family nitrogen regulator [Planctomycetota bacterium]|nr:P-II family nitrogen regulator [Planctomycetota bacterium]
MRKLTIVVKPFKADPVVRALLDAGATNLTLAEARGYGRQKGHLDLYRDEGARVTFLPKVRIECAVEDGGAEAAIEAAINAARTGRIGDGKIFLEGLR